MRRDRLVVGLLCIILAVWLFLSDAAGDNVAPSIAVLILGIIMVAISGKR